MTVEEALRVVDGRQFYVSWLCQGEDDLWHCCLRRKSDQAFANSPSRTVYIRRGKGKTMSAAIADAIQVSEIEDLLG